MAAKAALDALNGGDVMPLYELVELWQAQQSRKVGRKPKKVENVGFDEEEEVQVIKQVQELPERVIDSFYDAAISIIQQYASNLTGLVAIAHFTRLLLETKNVSVNRDRVADVAHQLHDMLLMVRGDGEEKEEAQEAISQLCESCWKKDLNKSDMVAQLLPYLIIKAYESPAKGAFHSKKHPIRRLFAVKEALTLIDLADHSSQLLRDVLLRCYMQPTFFKSPDAIGFLSFLFSLDLDFISDIDETIRNLIPDQRKAMLQKLGAIYHQAWTDCSDEYRQKIENECIQRFVEDAVHARSTSLFNAVRTLLQSFFTSKKQEGVDEMLFRLCSPVLWRGVSAANGLVRRQAALLLFDAFPLRDPTFGQADLELAFEKQFGLFDELLEDSIPAVRVASVHGIAKILSVYWDLIPDTFRRKWVQQLMKQLAHDTSSPLVRSAVFQALPFILDNHDTHALLSKYLSSLSPLIHDKNEKVRGDFITLLNRLKSIRGVRFFDVVPLDDLLDRLVLDANSSNIIKQLVLLFLNSYFPQNVSGSKQLARALELVRKRPEAALVFYRNVYRQVSVGSICKLAALLLKGVLDMVSTRSAGQESIATEVVVLQVLSELIGSVREQVLFDQEYVECKSFLAQHLNASMLETLLDAYDQDVPYTSDAQGAVWKVIGALGEVAQEELRELLMQTLLNMNETVDRKLLEAIVQCLVRWDLTNVLMEKAFEVLDEQDLFHMHREDHLHPIVVLTIVEIMLEADDVLLSTKQTKRLSKSLAASASSVMKGGSRYVYKLHKRDGATLFRLLEVYAKSLALASSATATKGIDRLDRSNIRNLSLDMVERVDPSSRFHLSSDLVTFGEWVLDLLPDFHSMVGDSATKRKHGGKSLSSREMLTIRWRNLFSLIAMLVSEGVAFMMERNDLNDSDVSCLEAYVGAVRKALTEETIERAVFYHGAQLLYVLQTSKETCSTDLEEWTSGLYSALETAHDKDEEELGDLWTTLENALDA